MPESPGSVLMIVENLPVPFDRRVWMEATTLRRAGYEVGVICPQGKGFEAEREEIEGVRIYRHRLAFEGDSAFGYMYEYATALWAEMSLSRRAWRDLPFDIVHICNPPDLLFLVALWHKFFHRAKVVFDQHDINPELYEAKYGKRGFFYRLLCLAESLSYRTADVVISTNESYRDIAIARGHRRSEDVIVVRSGPDLSRFALSDDMPTAESGEFAFRVGYVGVMGAQEGIDLLLEAVRELVFELGREDVGFVLVGSGPAANAMRAKASELGVEPWVEFLGRVSDEDLLATLSSCEICVNPDPKNPFNDSSTMNKVLEYMALGKPVVQFDLKEGRRSAGAASLYARPNDPADFAAKIAELLDCPDRCREMGAEGRRRMEEELEWAHQAPRLLEAYGRLAVRGKAGP